MTYPTFDEELSLWKNGYDYVIGVDEVGRGSFAGPVVASAVVLKSFCTDLPFYSTVNDSKLLSKKKRTTLAPLICNAALFYSTSIVQLDKINSEGIGKATEKALENAILDIYSKINNHNKVFVLIDGYLPKNITKHGIKIKNIIQGDKKVKSIAAASIIAKNYRDTLMDHIHNHFPIYNFKKNKGYGTAEHIKALKLFGLSAIHRQSFNLDKYIL